MIGNGLTCNGLTGNGLTLNGLTQKPFGQGIINKIESTLYANRTVDSVMTDKIGRTTFTPVRPAYLVADGATCFDVYKADGITAFTVDDLPSNYKIHGNFIYNDTGLLEGYIGASKDSPTRYYLTTGNSTSGDVALGFYDTFTSIATGMTIGDTLDFEILVTPTTVKVTANEIESAVVPYNKLPISNGLVIFGRDSITSLSTNLFNYLEITNTDTNETIIEYLPQSLGKADGTNIDYLQDTSGNGNHAQQMVQPEIPLIYDDSLSIGSPLNERGYIVAKALSKNLFNKRTFTDNTYVKNDGSLGSSPMWYSSEYNYLSENITSLAFEGLTDLGGPNVAFYTDDLTFISGETNIIVVANGGIISKPSNATYVRYSSREDVDPKADLMVNSGVTPLPYEAWEGYWIDEAMTTPFADGTRIVNQVGTSKSIAYIDDGTGTAIRADCDLGPVKKNVDITDGVVDNGVGYENYTLTNGAEASSLGFTGTYSGGRPIWKIADFLTTKKVTFEPSTEYLCVCNATINTCDIFLRNGTGTVWGASIYNILNDNTIGEQRVVMTTVAVIDDSVDDLVFAHNSPTTGQIQATIAIYKVADLADPLNPLTSALPTSGKFVYGNLWSLDPAYNEAVVADTADYLFDDTDPTEVVRKLLPCDTASRGDYLFTSLPKKTVALYDTPQTGDTLDKIESEFGIE